MTRSAVLQFLLNFTLLTLFSISSISMNSAMATLSQSQASLPYKSEASLQGEQYANEDNPGTRLDLNISLITTDDDPIQPLLPNREVHFYSFYESGTGGDYSLDLDRTVQRFTLHDHGHFWIGRTHPLNEATQGSMPTYVDAIGTNWAQNQSDALNPRVSGWIGTGLRLEESSHHFSMTTAYSPIFLPSFGPRLQLSETSAAEGSRFSRLPPEFYNENGTMIPIRYRLNVGDISRILFQQQAFISAGYENTEIRVDVMQWTAPDPNPDVNTDVGLVTHTGQTVTDDSANVIVDANPSFRRQDFSAVRIAGTQLPGKPLATVAYEWLRQELTASLESTPSEFLSLGVLNRWELTHQQSSDTGTFSPSYADKLIWAETGTSFYQGRIRPSLRVEQHVSSENFGRLIRPKIVYATSAGLNLFAFAQVMNGKDESYFGEWRSLGSAAMGVNWQW